MTTLRNVMVELDETDLTQVVARELAIPATDVQSVRVIRRSLDSRHRRPRWVLSLEVALAGDPPPATERVPIPPPVVNNPPEKIVIVGTGPAGLFAALRFADAGVPCTLIDRGAAVEERNQRARKLRAERYLDPESNLCYGEGGAGTYSDGKLYTRKKNRRVREIYQRLVDFGADPQILVDSHPHVGTNRLIPLMRQLRNDLLARGVELRFNTRMDDLHIEGGRLRGIVTNQGDIPADALLLATGHSARDTYFMLARRGVLMEPKSFAVGARCEHPQSMIDQIQFGQAAGHPALSAAEYFLRCQLEDRGVYSFCMCPGGFIIPTPTEPGHLNVNGMSNQSRKNRFANAALVVTCDPSDFAPTGDPLAGLEFQRQIERATFLAGGGDYTAPATRLTDLVAGRGSTTLPSRTSFRPSLIAADVADVLPPFVTEAIRRAVVRFDRNLQGYLTEEAVLVASETTTSSPVRILRGADCQSVSVAGLYPTGEGAGYSGGIVSSALDGMRVAEAILAG